MTGRVSFSNFTTLDELAVALGVKSRSLVFFAHVLPDERKYKEFKIGKKTGGQRIIHAPIPPLKALQRKISQELQGVYSPKSYVHGYVADRSIVTNAEKHTGQRWLLRVDVRDYFPSISFVRVRGMFMAKPFSMSKKVAIVLARICVKDGFLPQGSPVSPVISNLIFSGIDRSIRKLALENRCHYTRYCDDIFISSNNMDFPPRIAIKRHGSPVELSESFVEIIEGGGFKINEEKVNLLGIDSRQIVCGVVVNRKKNVPREYVREVRAMIYSWEKFGDLEKAQNHWQANYVNKNRTYQSGGRFNWVLRGKLAHIRAVKGEADSTYLKLARRLAALDPSFSVDPEAIKSHAVDEIVLIGEGKTDAIHVSAALKWFHSRSEYTYLNIRSVELGDKSGDVELLKRAEHLSSELQRNLTICMFDSDNASMTAKVKGSTLPYLDKTNNVYTLVIPSPPFRGDSICIEHLYKNIDLQKKDDSGRRLYLSEEFDEKLGFHKIENDVYRINPNNKTLIVDTGVVDMKSKENVALSKAKFADYVSKSERPFDKIDFEGFRYLFDQIAEIYNSYKK